MPSEPSSTLMFWSSTRWGILAAESNAWTAETSTASLARMSSRHTMSSSSDGSGGSPNAPSPSDFAPVRVIAGRAVLQIGDQLHFPPPAGHRVEHQTCDDREKGQQHEPGGQDRGRKARDDTFLEISHEDRNRKDNGKERQSDAEGGEERQRPLRAVEPDDGQQDAQAIAPGAELRGRPFRPRKIGGRNLAHRKVELERVDGKLGLDLEPA